MKVKFLPQDIELEIKPGQSVMDLAHENKIFIKSICNGLPSCSECRVRVIEGESNVLPPSSKELSLIGTGHFIDQRRLSCQLICYGDITVDLAEQVAKQSEGPRRPQGLKRTEIEHTHSVAGNLLEQDKELLNQAEAPQQQQQNQQRERRPDNRHQQQQQRHGNRNEQRHGNRNEQQGRNNQNRNDNQKNQKRQPFRFRPGQKSDS